MIRKLLAGLVTFAVVLSVIFIVQDRNERSRTLAMLRSVEPPAAYLIERDEFGVPSIFGATDAAVAFGVGMAHAEDDFRTIQLRLAPAKSQLGAITGKDGVVVDYIGHFLGSRQAALRSLKGLAPETIAFARGYAEGINAYAGAHPDEILRHQLFPVTELDVLAGFALVSPFFYGLDDVLTDLNNGEIPGEAPLTDRRGSNAIAVAPSRMADGSTVLISNSHQPWEGVAAWWEARIASGDGWSMAGSLFPGAPFILMGYNEHLSWTNTVNVPDLVDIYRLELDPSGRRYRFDGAWRDIDRESVWLKLRIGPFVLPVRQTVERSIHGPIIRNDKGAFAVRYAGMGEARHFEQYYRLNQATSFEEWTDAMRMGFIPSTNFIYADREGNIAYLYNAAFPQRDAATDWSGVLPGDSSEYLWISYEPFDAQPFYVNPPSGYLVNANNTPYLATAEEHNLRPADFAGLVGVEEKTTNRIMRLLDLFEAERGEELTSADLHRIKHDTAYTADSPLGRLFAELAADASLDGVDAEAAALLRSWDRDLDGVGPADSIAAAVMYDLYLGMRGYRAMRDHATILKEAAAHLREHFGRLDPPYREFSRLRRGDVDLPLTGGPDALRALYWETDPEDGRYVGSAGDSYIAVVRWGPDGELSARTIYPFGAAMGRPMSPHYADQAELFAQQRFKDAAPADSLIAVALDDGGGHDPGGADAAER